MSYNWQCPFCGRHATLTEASLWSHQNLICTSDQGKDGNLNYELLYVVCPNSECKEYTLQIRFFQRKRVEDQRGLHKYINGDLILQYQIRPRGSAKPFPDYIPEVLREDYAEACLILQDSPKASATLFRRCLQGLIRRYYRITKNTLYDEIKALESTLPPDLWDAVDSIREIGNVGAHSEKDVSKIVDVPPKAAHALRELIELLFEETYVKDHQRQQRIKKANEAAQDVKSQESPPDSSVDSETGN
ncbi:MAG: DUF4145 domain-containing protein [bacterium]